MTYEEAIKKAEYYLGLANDTPVKDEETRFLRIAAVYATLAMALKPNKEK